MKPYLSGEGSPNRGGLSLPKNKRILGAALLLVLGFVPQVALQFVKEPAQISVSTIEGNN